MGSEFRTRLDVQRVLRSVIKEGMAENGYPDFECLEYADAIIATYDRAVFMNHMPSKRVGFQKWTYRGIPNSQWLVRRDEWIDEQTWKLHVLCKASDSEVYSEDVAQVLVAWLNGPGSISLRKSRIGVLRVFQSDVSSYNDDSDLFQKRTVVDVTIQVPMAMESNTPVMYPEGVDTFPV